MPIEWGWRIGFFIGPVLGLIIIFLRRTIPESPRWLMTHGRNDEAERTVDDIEERVRREGVELEPVDDEQGDRGHRAAATRLLRDDQGLLRDYPRRSIYGFTMMVTQAFLYNAIFFTYALVLKVFYHVPPRSIPYYFFPFAIGNLLGPLLLGRLFDTVGRRKMILGTYGLSGVLLLIAAWLFNAGHAVGGHADDHVVGHLLLRLGRRVVGLPDGERDLPARAARAGDLVLLRDLAGRRRRRSRRRCSAT